MEPEIKDILSQPADTFRYFQVDGSSYLFNINNMRLHQVDSALFTNPPKSFYRFSEFDDEFNSKLKATAPAKVQAHYEGYNAIVEVTKNCNLSCVYCYRQNQLEIKNLDQETANQIIDYILAIDGKREIKGDSIRLIFFGGEPLLKFDIIQFIVLKLKNSIKNYKLKFHISTNGVELTKNKLKFLEDNEFNVQVSFEGEEQIQNSARPFKTGNGSFNIISENLSQINNHFKDKITIGISVSKLRFTISSTILKFVEMGFTKFNLLFITDDVLGINKIELTDKEALSKEIANIYSLYESEIAKGNKIVIHPITEIFTNLYTRIPEGKCNTTINVEAFNYDGRISPCQRFLSNPDYYYGDVSEGIDNEKVNKLRETNFCYSSYCESCWLNKICSGKCSYLNSIPFLDSSNQMGCYIRHLLWKSTIQSFIRLIIKNEAKLDEYMKGYLCK